MCKLHKKETISLDRPGGAWRVPKYKSYLIESLPEYIENMNSAERYIDEKFKTLTVDLFGLINEKAGSPLFDDIDKIFNIYDKIERNIESDIYNLTYISELIEINNKNIKIEKNVRPIKIVIPVDSLELSCLDIPVSNFKFEFEIYNIKTDDKKAVDYFDRLQKGIYNLSDTDKIKKRFGFFGREYVDKSGNTIKFYLYALNGRLNKQRFFEIFFHEFDHFFQDYNKRLKRNFETNKKEFEKLQEYNSLIRLFDTESEKTKNPLYDIFSDCMYFILNKIESNAFTAGILGTLVGLQAKHKDITNYKNYIAIYSTLTKIKYNVDKLEKYNSYQDWNKLLKILRNKNVKFFNLERVYSNTSENFDIEGIEKFKKEFIRLVNDKIDDFYKKAKAAIAKYINSWENHIKDL